MPINSSAKFGPGSVLKPSSPYSASKAAGDLLLDSWRRSYGLRFTLSNCSNNFGPGQHAEKLVPTLFRHLSSGRPAPLYGSGTNVRDWIHVDDHVLGILKILEVPKFGETYFFGASDEVSNLDLALAIGSFYGLDREASISFVEERPGHDRRYAIDWSATLDSIGWSPIHAKILDSIPELHDFYASRDRALS
jgi:dTDP-glucose 4,6-dehydratase